MIIGGDFNNVPAIRSSMFERLTAASFADALRKAEGARRTSARHRHPIDWIFTKNLRPQRGEVAAVDGASDHYPVLAELVHER